MPKARILPVPKPLYQPPGRGTQLDSREWYRQMDLFFEERDLVCQTLRRLAKRLTRASIPHAIVGGMAVNAHRYRRTTGDVDVLLTQLGFDQLCRLFVPKYYLRLPDRARQFMDRKSRVKVVVRVTGRFPGTGKRGPIAYPDPQNVHQLIKKVHYVDLVTLIQLKLAARRHRDFGDVVELIRFNELDETFADKLHSSVRGDYLECLDEKRREDEYEARE